MDVLQKEKKIIESFERNFLNRFHIAGECGAILALYNKQLDEIVVSLRFKSDNKDVYWLKAWLDRDNQLHVVDCNNDDILFKKSNLDKVEKEDDEEQISLLNFEIGDLSKYTTSMLFDSGSSIASAEFSYKGIKHCVTLNICGEISVNYKGENYKRVEDFPEELVELIKKNPNDFDVCSDDVFVWNNNWFEYLEEDNLDGVIYEDDLSKASPDEILEDMKNIAATWYENQCCA